MTQPTPPTLITPEQVKLILPDVHKLDEYFEPLCAAMAEFEINTPARVVAFIAQTGFESGEFKWMRELWGPTPQQLKYDPPNKLARELGNAKKGDGYKYRGGGVIQVTGHFNFDKYGKKLGVPLVDCPDRIKEPEIAFRIGGAFWFDHGLNQLADKRLFNSITKKINGGMNGEAQRQQYYIHALKVLGIADG